MLFADLSQIHARLAHLVAAADHISTERSRKSARSARRGKYEVGDPERRENEGRMRDFQWKKKREGLAKPEPENSMVQSPYIHNLEL